MHEQWKTCHSVNYTSQTYLVHHQIVMWSLFWLGCFNQNMLQMTLTDCTCSMALVVTSSSKLLTEAWGLSPRRRLWLCSPTPVERDVLFGLGGAGMSEVMLLQYFSQCKMKTELTWELELAKRRIAGVGKEQALSFIVITILPSANSFCGVLHYFSQEKCCDLQMKIENNLSVSSRLVVDDGRLGQGSY